MRSGRQPWPFQRSFALFGALLHTVPSCVAHIFLPQRIVLYFFLSRRQNRRCPPTYVPSRGVRFPARRSFAHLHRRNRLSTLSTAASEGRVGLGLSFELSFGRVAGRVISRDGHDHDRQNDYGQVDDGGGANIHRGLMYAVSSVGYLMLFLSSIFDPPCTGGRLVWPKETPSMSTPSPSLLFSCRACAVLTSSSHLARSKALA